MADENTTTTTTETVDTTDYKALYEKTKAANDKLSSENANYKRTERERMDEKARAEADLAEEREAAKRDREELARLKIGGKLSTHFKDAKTADKISSLLVEGKITEALDVINDYLTKYHADMKKTIEDELMANNPDATPQGQKGALTKAQILAITDTEARQKAIAENIHLFT